MSRYVHASIGFNSRLDEIQAAILRAKLPFLENWNQKRRELARRYEQGLTSTALRPVAASNDSVPSSHLFVVRAPSRDALIEALGKLGISTLVHYPIPVHLQPAYRDLEQGEGSCPVAETAAREILSLPLHPSLSYDEIGHVLAAVKSAS